MPESSADPDLIAAWLSARSVARGLPPPVPDYGGLRVDTALPAETRRFVFARPVPGVAELGRTIVDPLTPLKLCTSSAVMRAMLPEGWAIGPASYVMVCDTAMPGSAAPTGYQLALRAEEPIIFASLVTERGVTAGSGKAVERDGVFIFDQIVIESGHRRRGLGSALMSALAHQRSSKTSRFVLVATQEGRALYESLGWQIHAPYTTALRTA